MNGAFIGSCVVWRMVGFNHDMASFIEIYWKILFAKSRLFFLDYDLFFCWHLGEVITSFVLKHIAKIKINWEYIAVYTSMMLLGNNHHWPAITRANTGQDVRRHLVKLAKLTIGCRDLLRFQCLTTVLARFIGPTWGPIGADRTQVGPVLAPGTLLSGATSRNDNYFSIVVITVV